MRFTDSQLLEAHIHSARHRDEIERSQQCGCFNCCLVFDAKEIVDYIDGGETALCPHCGTDSVIGDASGIALTPQFLQAMSRRWF